MSKALRRMGIEEFSIGSMLYDLIGNSFGTDGMTELTPEQLW